VSVTAETGRMAHSVDAATASSIAGGGLKAQEAAAVAEQPATPLSGIAHRAASDQVSTQAEQPALAVQPRQENAVSVQTELQRPHAGSSTSVPLQGSNTAAECVAAPVENAKTNE